MSYLRELIVERRTLIASVVAGSVALGLFTFLNSLFVPALQTEFRWTRADFALTSTVTLVGVLSYPMAGRLADRFGARPVAVVGAIAISASYFAFSFLRGPIIEYYLVYTFLMVAGAAATLPVYGRVVAARFDRARGLALAMLTAGMPLLAAVLAPSLNDIIATHGWRVGYRLLGIMTLAMALGAILLLPSDRPNAVSEPSEERWLALATIARSRPFWLLAFGMTLCNFGNVLSGVQLTSMLLDSGATSGEVGQLVSAFAVAVVVGRIACGLALDRLPTPLVASVGMGLPAFGFALLALGRVDALALTAASVLIGVSMGAEGDIGMYASARYVGTRFFGTAFGLIVGLISGMSAVGAAVLSTMLRVTDNFSGFLIVTAVTTLLGAAALACLGLMKPAPHTTIQE